jgi:hypothetical protein
MKTKATFVNQYSLGIVRIIEVAFPTPRNVALPVHQPPKTLLWALFKGSKMLLSTPKNVALPFLMAKPPKTLLYLGKKESQKGCFGLEKGSF